MKQYIDSCGPGLIVALDNRAFVLLSPSSSSSTTPAISYELLAPPNKNNKNNKNNKIDKNNKNGKGTNGKDSLTSKKSKRSEEENMSNERNLDKQREEGDVDETKRKEDNVDSTRKFDIKYQQDTNAIQVVACKWIPNNSTLYCAVSRFDKSISIYSISPSSTTTEILEDDNTNNKDRVDITSADAIKKRAETLPGLVMTKPMLVHRVPKRSCTLAFATVPPLSVPTVPLSQPMIVVVAGDLAGDASAFPVLPSNPTSNTSDDKPTDGNTTNPGKPNQNPKQVRRLMLGHTASMLTSIHIIPRSKHGDITSTNTGGCKILTADRDEKVRISSFPNTFNIEGYLLGHTAYVTAMDLVHVGDNLGKTEIRCCVTASGDGSVRLWNIDNCAELCRIDYLAGCSNEDDGNDVEAGASAKCGEKIVDGCNRTMPMEIAQTRDCDIQDEEEHKPSLSTNKAMNKNDNDSNEVGNGNDEYGLNSQKEQQTMMRKDDEERSDAVADAATTTDVGDIDHAPVRVSVNRNGTILAVMRDGIDCIDLFAIAIALDSDSNNGLTGALTKLRSIECSSLPLGMAFTSDGSLTILTKEPTFIVHWKPVSNEGISMSTIDDGKPVLAATVPTSPPPMLTTTTEVESYSILQTIRNIGTQLKISMPHTLLETNESTGKVKLRKNIQEEKEGFVKYEPWLSVERVEKAKQRQLRNKKRKREKTRLLGS